MDETQTLDQLYEQALQDGGKLVIYAGGATPTQQDPLKNAFLKRFPKIDVTLVVDYSKFHEARIEHQIETNTLVPDVAALQSLQDFPRWKKRGHLSPYKPANFSKIHDSLKDQDGSWMAYNIFSFSYIYDEKYLNGVAPPKNVNDLTDARFKGKIASTYPHDDDIVLFLYAKYVEQYGWEWVDKLLKQDVTFRRGSSTAFARATSGESLIGLGTFAPVVPANTSTLKFVKDEPFVAWGQRVALLKKAKNVAAGKLFLNWLITEETQKTITNGWSVRTDVTLPGNLPPVWENKNANFDEFVPFMEDRTAAEVLRTKFALFFGEVTGNATTGALGMYPGKP
ncbi:TPA: hypothetical protein N0F65_001756 [Lagenidium giganteum]|uniref:Uncharacterized protein n=1 Tax=Lagenidium giganteum TaxID=4803 RepID=A0AAV2Z722_9STRA|nr:TPA: hypothetical protein N0F65_001756 [Lagenidium giganteum]